MITINWPASANSCIVAHSETSTSACGGTLLQLLAGAKRLDLLGGLCSNRRAKEAQRSAIFSEGA